MFKIVERFKSIQSEGTHAGTPASFIRFYGCNLACKFGTFECDEGLHTNKQAITMYSIQDLVDYCKGIKHVVITGGEPSLNDLTELIDELQEENHYVQVETNGANLNHINNANFITYSPKRTWDDNAPKLFYGFNELKLLGSKAYPPDVEAWASVKNKYIQPIGYEDGWNLDNVRWCANFVVDNPEWKLSLQTHKIYGGQ